MNGLDEKLSDWSQSHFNIKMQTKDSVNFLRSKNGNTWRKLMHFMSDRIKSKENGEQIKRFCDSIECKDQSEVIGHQIKDIESKISDIRNKLMAEEFRRKSTEIRETSNLNKEFVSTLILDTIEKISAKNKHCTQLKPNFKTINETIASYENLFTDNGDICLQSNQSSDETLNVTNSVDLNQILEQINQLMTSIDSILYDLNQLEVNKPIKVSIDWESVSNSLVESRPGINIKPNEREKEKKISAITSKLVSVQNLMNKYQTIRSEKFAKNKEKLKKVIYSCDEFIQQSV